jgi:hypothetical protein
MVYRVLSLCLAALALMLFVSAPALADVPDKEDIHEGKVVSVTGNKLVMTDKEDKEHTFTLADNARLRCDGKICKAEDFKTGQKIRVINKKGEQTTAWRVDVLDKETQFPKLTEIDK